ncbi:MAG: hypothetical protein QOC93_3538 [Actinomycetota bacterium]|nr:hypothetical protein [Actinomycetota bacterium]
MPKSSTDSWTPSARSPSRTSSTTSSSLITTVSVISRTSSSGGTWYFASSAATSSGRSRSSRLRAERFTAIGSRSPSARQEEDTSSARSSTYRENGRTRSVCSTIGTNSAGAIEPRRGCSQRISASAPIGAPEARSIDGWRCRTSWSGRSSAARSSAARASRSRLPASRDTSYPATARPDRLASYIATSARRSSSAVSHPSPGATGVSATPTPASTVMATPPTTTGSPSTASSSRARASAIPAPDGTPGSRGSRRANSSPPSRASISPSRSASPSRTAVLVSRRSPAACPSVSLTSLKWLKSSRRSPSAVPSAPLARTCSPRSSRQFRFGRPVRASWVASCSLRVATVLRRWCTWALRSADTSAPAKVAIASPSRSPRTTSDRKQSRTSPIATPPLSTSGVDSTVGSARASPPGAPCQISPCALPRVRRRDSGPSSSSISTTSAEKRPAAPRTAAAITSVSSSRLSPPTVAASRCHATRSLRARSRPAYAWCTSQRGGTASRSRRGSACPSASTPNAAVTLPTNVTASVPTPSRNGRSGDTPCSSASANATARSFTTGNARIPRSSAPAPATLVGSGTPPATAYATHTATEEATAVVAALNATLTGSNPRQVSTSPTASTAPSTTTGPSVRTTAIRTAASAQSNCTAVPRTRTRCEISRLTIISPIARAAGPQCGGGDCASATAAQSTQSNPAATAPAMYARRRGCTPASRLTPEPVTGTPLLVGSARACPSRGAVVTGNSPVTTHRSEGPSRPPPNGGYRAGHRP